jgi:hypothetical protein
VAIASSDIVKRFSVAAAAGNTTAGTAATSLGDQISTTDITDATVANLFSNVSDTEAAAGKTVYRCFFVLNNHASLTYTSATVAVNSQTSSGSDITIALDDIAVSAKGSGSAQAAVIASETTTPTGVGAFGAGPLSIGDIAAGSVKAIWVKQVTSAGASAANPDGAVLRFSGGSLP